MAEVPDQPSHTHKILSMIEQCHSEGKYWDVQLRVGTKVFKCLRALLATNSEYFDTMFSSNFEESNAADQPIILHEMDASAFGELLHFMYTGDICVNDSNVLKLLFMSDYLRLRSGHVKEQCLVHVRSRSQKDEPISNALDLLCFAHLKGEKVFVDILNAHISCHLYHYSKDVQLMEISFENLNALLKCSKDCILPLHGSANVLLKIVHNWINHNREGRSQYRSNLMENIDLANVSAKFALSLMNRLQNVLVDEVMNLCRDIESFEELKRLVMGIDTNFTDDDVRIDGIISFNVKNIRKLPVDRLEFSPSCMISGLSWKIGTELDEDEFFMYLCCDGADVKETWNCYARATFTIVSHKEGGENFVKELEYCLFSSKAPDSSSWAPDSFLKWDDLIHPKNGYVNDDGSITVNARVQADIPFLKMI